MCAEDFSTVARQPLFPFREGVAGLDRVIIRGSYDCLPLRSLIMTIKYSFWSAAGTILDDICRPLATALVELPPATIIVPVPLHPRRRRERGFNQAEVLAVALGRLLDRPVRPLLRRVRYTTAQATLKADQRTKNIRDAFAIASLEKAPERVILVDDVITTGSTMAECAAVLRQHGVKQITAVALAKG